MAFTEMCWFQRFSQDLSGNWYVDTGGVLPLVPANGFFIGAVVAVSQAPTGIPAEAVIASNGNVVNEGWELVMFAGTPTPEGQETVGFAFRVFDGAGIAAQVVTEPLVLDIDPDVGVDQLLIRVMAWFEAPDAGAVNGAINIDAEGARGSVGREELTSPYVNSDPLFKMGVGSGIRPFELPNCIHGLVGGDGVPGGATVSGSMYLVLEGVSVDNFPGWFAQIGPWTNALSANAPPEGHQYQIVAPDGGTLVPTLNPTNGWRANNPPVISGESGAAPNPLLPFLGAVDLDFAFPVGFPREPVNAACSQPSIFLSERPFST